MPNIDYKKECEKLIKELLEKNVLDKNINFKKNNEVIKKTISDPTEYLNFLINQKKSILGNNIDNGLILQNIYQELSIKKRQNADSPISKIKDLQINNTYSVKARICFYNIKKVTINKNNKNQQNVNVIELVIADDTGFITLSVFAFTKKWQDFINKFCKNENYKGETFLFMNFRVKNDIYSPFNKTLSPVKLTDFELIEDDKDKIKKIAKIQYKTISEIRKMKDKSRVSLKARVLKINEKKNINYKDKESGQTKNFQVQRILLIDKNGDTITLSTSQDFKITEQKTIAVLWSEVNKYVYNGNEYTSIKVSKPYQIIEITDKGNIPIEKTRVANNFDSKREDLELTRIFEMEPFKIYKLKGKFLNLNSLKFDVETKSSKKSNPYYIACGNIDEDNKICKKKLFNGECTIHGKPKSPIKVPMINAIFTDYTGHFRVKLFENIIEQICNKSRDDFIKEFETKGYDKFFSDLNYEVKNKTFEIIAKLNIDNYGIKLNIINVNS